ncbi:MAG: PD40 domain-containing protein [Anaerolineae bacterium]|nr:PD40 domain-containing protein [Anaerolineae bacterium]
MKRRTIVIVLMLVILLAAFDSPAEIPTPAGEPLPTVAAYDGPSRIVFSSNRGDDPNKLDLYLIDPESAEITPINTGLDAAILPSWSPDGNQIAFALAGVWNLYTVYADGTNLAQVTDFRSNNPDWSPDGSQLVFQSDHQNEPQDTPDIYVWNLAEEELSELLDAPDLIDYNPRWSPDGSQILFISNNSGSMEIFYMNPDGSEITQITDGDDPISGATWSPDGEQIVFVSGKGPNTDLYTINKDGAADSVVRLTDDEFSNTAPAYSPDGESIVFASNRSGNWDLWVVNADGSELTQLTDDEYYDGFPDWSP